LGNIAANSDRPRPYTFQVVDDEAVNACNNGGFVYVNTGLLKLADNEAELASHSMKLVTLSRHAVEQMRETASLVVLPV